MTAEIDYLPIWKKNATVAERFMELAQVAQKHPERFINFVLIYQETLPNGRTKVRFICDDKSNTNECLGILEIGKYQLIEDTRR